MIPTDALKRLVTAVNAWAETIDGPLGSEEADERAQAELDLLDARDAALKAALGAGEPTQDQFDRDHDPLDVAALRREITDLRARLKEVETSMARHFAEEHLAGDGPEIDRWKARLAAVEAALNKHHHTVDTWCNTCGEAKGD